MNENKLFEKTNILTKLFTTKYKIITSFLVIFLINLFLFLGYNSHTMLFVDSSRELYIPMAMNDGGVLYKDIFNVYAPLAYQINALITSIFGENINTFFYAGFINSTLILWGLFLLVRFVVKVSSLYKISIICLIMATCVYSISQTNYIFPYSYSLVYSLTAFIWSLVTILYFIKKDNKKFLYLSFFLYGVSITCKYEFFPFIFVLLGICCYKKVSIKSLIIAFSLMLLTPLISLIDLFFRGVSFNDLKQATNYIISLSKAKSVNILYTYLGFIPNLLSLKEIIINFAKFIGALSIFSIYYFLFLFFIKHTKEKVSAFYYFLTILIGIIPFFLSIKYLVPYLTESNAFYFSWIGIFVVILFLSKWKKILNNNQYLFIIFISTISCSVKCILNISFNSYGTYFFPLIFICCILYYSEIELKSEEKPINTNRIIFLLFILLTTLLYSLSNINRQDLTFTDIKFPLYKGDVYPEKMYANSVLETIHYIKQNSQEQDRILVLPEGAMINFFTDRKSHNKFYYLIPPNIEVFGEDNIVKEMEKDLPEYLVIQPMSFANFNETYFCESFGKKICSLIPKYYEKPTVLGTNFWIAIYKKKEQNEK